jgi:hypothetical protein
MATMQQSRRNLERAPRGGSESCAELRAGVAGVCLLPEGRCSVEMTTHRLKAAKAFGRPKLIGVVVRVKRRRSVWKDHPTDL